MRHGPKPGHKIIAGMVKDDAFYDADTAAAWLKEARCSYGQINIIRALIERDMIKSPSPCTCCKAYETTDFRRKLI